MIATYMICASSGTFACFFENDDGDVSPLSEVVDAARVKDA